MPEETEEIAVIPMSNDYQLICVNGYTVENPRIEGNKILIECYPKETEKGE